MTHNIAFFICYTTSLFLTVSKLAFLARFWGRILAWHPFLHGLLGSHCVTHRWWHHLPSIRAQLCQDWSSGTCDNWLKLDLGGSIVHKNWDKNGKKRLEIGKAILFYIHKHCTTSFTSKQLIFYKPTAHFHCIWLLSKVANLKRKTMIPK